jgi:hypothetical protein
MSGERDMTFPTVCLPHLSSTWPRRSKASPLRTMHVCVPPRGRKTASLSPSLSVHGRFGGRVIPRRKRNAETRRARARICTAYVHFRESVRTAGCGRTKTCRRQWATRRSPESEGASFGASGVFVRRARERWRAETALRVVRIAEGRALDAIDCHRASVDGSSVWTMLRGVRDLSRVV